MRIAKTTLQALLVAFLMYCEPVTARYIQADPLGLRGGIGPYPYVESDPLKKIDPEGEQSVTPAEPFPKGPKIVIPGPLNRMPGEAGYFPRPTLAGVSCMADCLYTHVPFCLATSVGFVIGSYTQAGLPFRLAGAMGNPLNVSCNYSMVIPYCEKECANLPPSMCKPMPPVDPTAGTGGVQHY
jgi:hypothetical protein